MTSSRILRKSRAQRITSWLSRKVRVVLQEARQPPTPSNSNDTTKPSNTHIPPSLAQYSLRELARIEAHHHSISWDPCPLNDQYLAQIVNHIRDLLAGYPNLREEYQNLVRLLAGAQTVLINPTGNEKADAPSYKIAPLPPLEQTGQPILSLHTLLWNYRDLEYFCRNLWEKFGECSVDIYTACLSTNLAIGEMQRLHNDFASRFPHLASFQATKQLLENRTSDVQAETEIYLRHLSQQPWSEALHQIFLHGPSSCSEIGSSTESAQGSYQIRNATVTAILSVAAMKASTTSLRGEDCLMDGISAMIDDRFVPTWLPSALNAYNSVSNGMTNNTVRCWNLQENYLRTVTTSVDSEMQCNSGRLPRGLLLASQASKRWLGCRRSMPALHACLERFPGAACSIGYQIGLDAYLGALKYCSLHSDLIVVAHIYRACKRSGLLRNALWDDLEYVLNTHQRGLTCFNSSSTGCSTPVVNMDSIWHSHSETSLLCISDFPRLEAPPLLTRLVQRLKIEPDADFWALCRSEAMSMSEGSFQQGLESLTRALDSLRLELAFDYIHFHASCRTLLQTTLQKFGSNSLNVTISGLLSSDTTFGRLHPAYRSESDIWKMAVVLRRFIKDHGREIKTKATRTMVQSHSSNFMSPTANPALIFGTESSSEQNFDRNTAV